MRAHPDLDSIVWEPGDLAVERPRAAIMTDLAGFVSRNPKWVIGGCYADLVAAMLPNLQAWVAGYYHRSDAWSYGAHRALFDGFCGAKVEHTSMVAAGEEIDAAVPICSDFEEFR